MIITKTPVRVSFFGGGTDFPEFFNRHGGAVLSTTIDKFCYLTVSPLSDFFDYRIKVAYSRAELVNEVSEIRHPAVRACLESFGIGSNIEINYFSDLPARTGLGTSSSFVVGLLNALHAFNGKRVSAESLATEAVRIEREMIGENVGLQDQYAAACGGFNYIEFKSPGEVHLEKIVCPADRFRLLEENLVMFYTGIQRDSDGIQKKHVARLENNTESLLALAGLAARGREILVSPEEDIRQFGELLDRGWQLKRGLNREVSSSAIDVFYEKARAAGAVGGKLLGAGGGGFLLLFVPAENQEQVRRSLDPLLEVKFQFEKRGSRVIFFDQ